MISASLSFSSNNSSAVASKSSERWLNAVRRYFLDAFSAPFSRFSISASSNGANCFTFSPVAGLIEAIAISISYIAFPTNGGANSVSPASRSSALHIVCELDSQSFGNQNAIEHIEKPLHKQCQQCGGNSSLQDRCVIVQIEAAQDRFAEPASADERSERSCADINHRAG